MKKLLLGLVFMSSLSLMAQEGVHLSLKGGPQFSMALNKGVSDSPYMDYVSTWGSFYGLEFDYHFSETIGAGLGFNLSNQGQKYEYYKSGNKPYDGYVKNSYLRIPVMLKFNSSPGPVMFKGFIGPQFSMLMNSSYEAGDGTFKEQEFRDGNNNVYTSDDPAGLAAIPSSSGSAVKDEQESMTIGLNFGLGLAFSVTDNIQVDFGVRAAYDFTDAGNVWEDYEVDIPVTDSDFEAKGTTNNITGAVELGLTYIIN